MEYMARSTLPAEGAINSTPPESNWSPVDPEGDLERAGCWLLVQPHTIGWYYRAVYTGHTLKKRETDWLLMTRATFGRNKKICFVSGRDPYECVTFLAQGAKHQTLEWKDDLY